MNAKKLTTQVALPRAQSGATTIAITLLLLVILSLVVLFSTNVAFFEQRTASNEYRARLVEQAAEYAANLAGEYFKSRRELLISNTAGGWLATGTTKWALCSAVTGMAADHPCMSERDATRRAQLYFYTADGTVSGSQSVPYRDLMPSAIELETAGAGGSAAFATTTTVRALLCRIDTSLATPECRVTPAAGNRVAISILSDASLTGENSTASVKQVWATYQTFSPSSAVPLVASGLVKGVGNAQIVVSPNAGGYGVPASIWSPCPVDIDAGPTPAIAGCPAPAPGASVGSVSTCHLGDYLKNTPESQLLTTCATTNNACGCPAVNTAGTDFLSGHSGSTKQENIDVLDRDNGQGSLPDITFFPGSGLDKDADQTDDSLFEWIFGVDYEASEASTDGATLQNCTVTAGFGGTRTTNCALKALEEDFEATSVATCANLSSASSGIIYVRGACTLPSQVGSPTNAAIVVVSAEDPVEVTLNGTIFYGMLFLRSDNGTAHLKGVGNSKVFGSIVVQGDVDIAGTLDLVYQDTSASSNTNAIPKSAKFGLVPGSWLDNRSGF